ncbi:Uncharacterised protein [uncultured archaeon]|nr:Uncharacterised protein [uncultured archaeon]
MLKLARTKLQESYDGFDELIDLCEKQGLKTQSALLRKMRDNLPPDPEDPEAYEIQDATGKQFPQNKTTLELFELKENLSRLDHLDASDANELSAVETELGKRLDPSGKRSTVKQLIAVFDEIEVQLTNTNDMRLVAIVDIQGDANVYVAKPDTVEKLRNNEKIDPEEEGGECILAAETFTEEG